jgi:hypothetical protein
MRSALFIAVACAFTTVAACGDPAPALTDASDGGGGSGTGSADASADADRAADSAASDAGGDATIADGDVPDARDGVLDGGLCPTPAPSGPCRVDGEWCSFGVRGGCTCEQGTWRCITPPTS